MNQHWFRHPVVFVIALLTVTWILYSPSLGFPFTNWDDDIHVTENRDIQNLSWDGAANLLLPTEKYMYHPLTMLSYMIDWHFSEGTPVSFHRTNILLHMMNIVLLFILLLRLGIDKDLTVFCVAIFAFHPVQVESVAWISARKELLYGFFFLLSLLFYLWWHQKQKMQFLAASFFFFVCSLLAKPMAVTLPLLILAVHALGERKTVLRSIYALVPYFVTAIGYFIFLIGTNESASPFPIEYFQPLQRVSLTFYAITFYLWKAAFPIQLSACYSYPPIDLPLSYFLTTAAVLAAVFLTILSSTSKRGTVSGLIVYIIAILPVVQIIPFHNASLVADRYAYLPIVGIALFAGYGFRSLFGDRGGLSSPGHWLKRFLLIVSIAVFFLLAAERVFVWQGSIELFTDVLQKNPSLPLGYGNRGNAKLVQGNYRGAIADFDVLLSINPEDGKALYNQGNAYLEMQQYDTALYKYSSAIERGFISSSLWYNRGRALFYTGNIDEAIRNYTQAARVNPVGAESYYSLGFIYLMQKKNPAVAARFFDTSIVLNNRNPDALYHRAMARFALEEYGNALDDATRAIVMESGYGSAPFVRRLDSAIAMTVQRIDSLTNVLNSSSHNVSAYRLRSTLYRRVGDTLRARMDEERARSMLRGARYE